MSEEPQPTGAVKVFFSYAHEDKDLCLRLQEHFSFLRREKKIVQWFDGEIKPGQEWRREIERRLDSADVILLLISAAFANSEFCYEVEMDRAMGRHDAGEAVVVPIILERCDWLSAPFARLQAIPGGDKAISDWTNVNTALYEVARGVREVVEDLLAERTGNAPADAWFGESSETAVASAHVPPPPSIDFVPRKDREGRDILERLKRELTRDAKRLLVLWGEGGVGKTTLAAEATRELTTVFGGRIVWAGAEKVNDFTYSALLNEIAVDLGEPALTRLAPGPKEQAVTRLLTAAPTLVVLDNFETVALAERDRCADLLAGRSLCAALITTRERVGHEAARHIHVESMDEEEARQFVARWVAQEAQNPGAFEGLDYEEIIRAADARPYVLQWVLARIDLATEPRAVLEELSRGGGEVGARVFQRSFELPQLGDDGRDTLLALSLFSPGAARDALAEVAGFGDDSKRLDEAVRRLAALRLLETLPGGRRLAVKGLTRSLARSRLSEEKRAEEFRRRFVAYFMRYAWDHRERTTEDFDALEAEKDNARGALDEAFQLREWESVYLLSRRMDDFLYQRGYWDEAIRSGEMAMAAARNAGNELVAVSLSTQVARVRCQRGEYEEAEKIYRDAIETCRAAGDEARIATGLNLLGSVMQSKGELDESLRLFGESLEIEKRLGNQKGVAMTSSNIGNVLSTQGQLDESKEKYKESLAIWRELGDQQGIGTDLLGLGLIAQKKGDLKEARRYYAESLEVQKKLGNRLRVATTLNQLGHLALAEGDRAETARLLREALSIFEDLGSVYAEVVRRNLRRLEGQPVGDAGK